LTRAITGIRHGVPPDQLRFLMLIRTGRVWSLPNRAANTTAPIPKNIRPSVNPPSGTAAGTVGGSAVTVNPQPVSVPIPTGDKSAR
jgi:hypothetical protein